MPGVDRYSMENIVHKLVIRQMPMQARSASKSSKERRALDPPPIVELQLIDTSYGDNRLLGLTSNALLKYTMHATLVDGETRLEIAHFLDGFTPALSGTYISSGYLLPVEGSLFRPALFTFSDLGVRAAANQLVRLHFSLSLIEGHEHQICAVVDSDPFRVCSSAKYDGVGNATPLTRALHRSAMPVRMRNGPTTRRSRVSTRTTRRGASVVSTSSSSSAPSLASGSDWCKEEPPSPDIPPSPTTFRHHSPQPLLPDAARFSQHSWQSGYEVPSYFQTREEVYVTPPREPVRYRRHNGTPVVNDVEQSLAAPQGRARLRATGNAVYHDGIGLGGGGFRADFARDGVESRGGFFV
ncbi:hypothetical protein HMN09_00733000 [Mycena chlorophos]|uniref:Velvet domain-containing protein n=1 Tax=Mycena chlorophos TaxID=658473 RepID=A0A8H6W5N1_MYCCL|nr:hypothetical protein HMN09_00733000 [Mycena chlorophos]